MRFKAVGNAPIMKQNFYKITAANRFQAVIQFLRKELGWKAGEPLVQGNSLALIEHELIPSRSSFLFGCETTVHLYQFGVLARAGRYSIELVQGE